MLLEDKKAIVTGGATGIGRATAILFAEHGAKVIVADVNDSEAEKTVSTIHDAGGEARFVHTDVSDQSSVADLMYTVKEEYGSLDVLANVAGVQRAGFISDFSEEDWDLTHNVNVKGMFFTAKYGVPLMGKGGAIVNVASLAALTGGPGMTAYCSSKGAVYSYSRSLAAELGPDIRVNCLCPGWTDTPFNNPAIDIMFEGSREKQDEFVKANVPLQRQAVPEEQAHPMLFLASDMSSFMTGQALVIDGGMF